MPFQSFDAAAAATNKSNPNSDKKPYVPLAQRAAPWAGSAAQTATAAAPANASAAPVKTDKVFTGLCEALNAHQQYLVQSGKYEVADVYSIQFAPQANLGAFSVVKPGQTDLSNTATTNPATAADKLDSSKGSVNTKSQIWQVTAGTQIVQLIDQIMRSSSYITGQQNVQISTVTDPKTGLQTQTANPNPGNGTTAWYKITMQATQLKYDNKRKDHAYSMSFIVTPYAITQMMSQYFPDSRYRGSHKSYNYWFTGLNTQILNFEQEYNSAYRLTLSGLGKDLSTKTVHDFRDQPRRTYMAASENHTKGQSGDTNEPGDNAASFLYSPTDLARVNLKIVGDPAWMQQGEVGVGMIANAFNFNPYLADGTINYDSQEVVFDVNFNAPQDYDFNTGVVNVNANTGKPQESFTYTAIKCKNIFSKGRFEQQLEGRLLIEFAKDAKNTQGRSGVGNVAAGSRDLGIKQSAMNTGWDDSTDGTPGIKQSAMNTGWDDSTNGQAPPSTQPAAPPGNPTSSGSIDYNAGLAGTSGAVPDASAAPTNNTGVDDQAAKAIKNQALADAATASGDTNAAAFYNRVAQNNRENAEANARTAAKYGVVTTPPQKMNKEF